MNEKSQVLLKQLYASKGRKPKNEKQAEQELQDLRLNYIKDPKGLSPEDLVSLYILRDERKRKRGEVGGDED